MCIFNCHVRTRILIAAICYNHHMYVLFCLENYDDLLYPTIHCSRLNQSILIEVCVHIPLNFVLPLCTARPIFLFRCSLSFKGKQKRDLFNQYCLLIASVHYVLVYRIRCTRLYIVSLRLPTKIYLKNGQAVFLFIDNYDKRDWSMCRTSEQH